MIGLSVFAYIVQIAISALELEWYTHYGVNKSVYNAFQTLIAVYYTVTLFILLSFALKYWVLSRRVTNLFTNQNQSYINFQAYIIFFTVSFLIVTSETFYLVVNLRFQKFEPLNLRLAIAVTIAQFLPDLILLCLFFNAYKTLIKSPNSGNINNKQMLIQSTCFFAAAITDMAVSMFYYLKENGRSFFIVLMVCITLTALGQIALTFSLIKIAQL